mmetsp:Transcript_50657/g.141852  ORF Transcript_50657/g.141852 Transcript_50657/m.141852 type:complete len:219 (+) Transcript_50657:210-866(+)
MAYTHTRATRGLTSVVLALLGVVAWKISVRAFVGGNLRGADRVITHIARSVNVLPDFEFPNFGGSKDDPTDDPRTRRNADESTSRVVECNMPLGVDFEERGGGNIFVKNVDPSSDAFSQGVRPGAQLVMVSATFGDDMWNARGVGMTQLNTVIASRFGATIKLALEQEDKNILSSFFPALAPKKESAEAEKKKQAELASIFDKEEDKLKGKNMWNPFR